MCWSRDRLPTPAFLRFLCGSAGKESACNAGDLGLIHGLGRSPGEGKGYPLQYSGLDNSMGYTICGVAKSQTRLSDFHYLFKVSISRKSQDKDVERGLRVSQLLFCARYVIWWIIISIHHHFYTLKTQMQGTSHLSQLINGKNGTRGPLFDSSTHIVDTVDISSSVLDINSYRSWKWGKKSLQG